ncbi:hypothetical protein MMC16_003817 [Acarospora aff. strigata]|nr:hypothetical protein [Acarospora aff. strigata]
MAIPVTLRPPSVSQASQGSFNPPPLDWLLGTWHVAHSTLPMWKSKRNVRIAYSALSPAANGADRLDDLVSYQALKADKIKTVHGVDTASGKDSGAWDWRGRGLLAIASSHWEVLGSGGTGDERWVVTYFAKTLFTPSGVDIYSRSKSGLSAGLVAGIREALNALEDSDLKRLAAEIFEITSDNTRPD